MLLLDTNAFLWFTGADRRLSATAAAELADATDVRVSAVVALEIAIKASLGKLRLAEPAPSFVPRQMALNGFRSLPVTQDHALAVQDLPLHHRDPFDRLLVAQARVEGLTLVSGDRALAAYDVPLLW